MSQSAADIPCLQGSVKEFMSRFDVFGVEVERLCIPFGGFCWLAAIPEEIAQAATKKGVARILLEEFKQVFLAHRRRLNDRAIEQGTSAFH